MSGNGASYAKIALMLRGLEGLARAGDLSNAERASACVQVIEIADLLARSRNPDLAVLQAAFRSFAEHLQTPVIEVVEAFDSVEAVSAPRGRARQSVAGRRFSRELRRLAMVVTAMVSLAAPTLAAAADPTAAYHVDDSITNPATGQSETIKEIVNSVTVRTAEGNLIIVPIATGTSFTVVDQGSVEFPAGGADPTGTSKTYTVVSVDNTDPAHPKLKVKDSSNHNFSFDLVTPLVDKPADYTGSTGSGTLTLPTGTGNSNNVSFLKIGGNGSNGADGGGVRICFGILGCITVGKDPGNGGAGGAGGNIGYDPGQTRGQVVTGADILTVTDKLSGITAISQGGNGGEGGYGYGYVISGTGGAGGAGGDIKLTNEANVTTKGLDAAAIFVLSRAGTGGAGGRGYLASEGGTGGPAAQAGDVEVYNYGTLHTVGYRSAGISAQSLGGGAGGGGSSYGIVAGAAAGSTGGNGGSVRVENYGGILTGDVAGQDFDADGHDISGVDAYGILAQSIGGSGGSSGDAGGLFALGDAAAGAGGNAGAVTVITGEGSWIHTLGKGATGILAQSIGGGGGAGGSTVALVALGTNGGSGGNGGDVVVENAGWIKTEGDYARGILAQSIGGGGGSGGDAGALAALGGKGGTAADAGDVSVTNTGAIDTAGDHASAIQAQSIGGGGGDGGSSGGVFLTIGGQGKVGGKSGSVTVTHGGAIHTTGDDSHGIFAESVGGGGGNGGSATSISVFAGAAIGGQGDSGGDGGAVTVNLVPITVSVGGATVDIDPTIDTEGDRSRGIFAQSVGGGGGAGGFASATAVGYGLGASAAIGGDGAIGGKGGAVWLEGNASITTQGDNAEGIFAQSVGGGGGAGGYALSLTVAASQVGGGAFAVGIGGQGGGGGDGGQVDVLSGGSIETDGQFSTGFVAQSVGGGGGTGGYALAFAGAAGGVAAVAASVGVGGSGGSGGDGGNVGASFDGAITTHGDDAKGALIQSVGGGGGGGGYAISGSATLSFGEAGAGSAGVGGTGGDGGQGGSVSGYVGGDVTTDGERSDGVVIQSVGGGGGAGGFAITGSLSAASSSGAVGVGVGGVGGGGGDGGEAYGVTDGTVTTNGGQSTGVLVQSVGGGGGSGGFSIAGTLSLSTAAGGAIGLGLGGAGGDGGDGASAGADINGDVVTYGDQSAGVIVQSVGGGGGSGGMNIAGAATIGGAGGLAVAVGLGGSGGGGGDGGAVEASAGNIRTEGKGSGAFLAQSVGGGGGAGGLNISGAAGAQIVSANALTVGLGGSGGDGGDGGTVKAALEGLITTLGDGSDAVVVQSVGGGGGSGGLDISGALTASGTASASLGVGLGGSGGGGGDGGAVEAKLTAVVGTGGDNSAGVKVQSLGGGGGSGGFNVTGDASLSGVGGAAAAVGVGGSGGAGGAGDTAKLDLTGVVATLGDGSDAILVQSAGGGGGDGGFNIAGGLAITGTGAGTVSVGVGGSGGGGGGAGDVTLALNSIAASGGDAELKTVAFTFGDEADAVTVQSVGGGGGDGAFNVAGALGVSGDGNGAVSVGVGGSGGGGGLAGAVKADVTGDIGTVGDGSHGFLAQSVGGGGGNGGFNVSGSLSAASGGAAAVSVGVGGSGGGGGDGGAVTASLTGQVSTEGKKAFAIKAQSVGGGGGSGGFDVAGALGAAGSAGGAVSVGVGGSGGAGGDGGVVSLDLTGGASTLGDFGDALVAQSLGGGGGDGGFNITGGVDISGSSGGSVNVGVGGSGGGGGDGAAVTLVASSEAMAGTGDATVVAHTEGKFSRGILAQSAGGGGGTGGFDVAGGLSITGETGASASVGVGGSGGDGGDGGAVSATVRGDVETAGYDSAGVTAQSVGGGGGSGGFNITGVVALGGSGGTLGVGVGGSGGGGGDGGAVDLDIIGQILTEGGASDGVMAQSVGGGGGSGGFNVTGEMTLTADGAVNIGVGVGGSGGDGGQGGDVSLVLASNAASETGESNFVAYTKGVKSRGVVAQSVGGGGGSGGMDIEGQLAISADSARNVGVGLGGSGGAGGDAGDVTASIIGDVTTLESDALGVLIQSQGGGGGAGGLNVTGGITIGTDATGVAVGIGGLGGGGGDAGDVTADLTGDVSTKGRGAAGVTVVSQGGGGGVGGMNVTGGLAITALEEAGGLIGVGVGGFGGGGGDGGTVTASLTGDIATEGDDAIGALIQSLGGGGGAGGINITGGINIASGQAGTVGFGLGGFGGAGGDAGDVTVTRVGETQTDGHDSDAIVVQSVGGSGGSGGLNVTGNISVSLEQDSLGVGLGIGGFGGGGGNAGDVDATVTGSVYAGVDVTHVPITYLGNTIGYSVPHGSSGVVIQSVGGGGGNGGLNVTGDIVISGGEKSASRAASIGIGGFGGAGGDAGNVTATVKGADGDDRIVVSSKGDTESAVAIQSIGGSGGNGGINISGSLALDGSVTLGVGGFGGGGGVGGDVTAVVDADLYADGGNSRGLLVQSLGGGGGNGGISIAGGIKAAANSSEPSVTFGVGGGGGTGDVAGDVSVVQTGQVVVNGTYAIGVSVESIGGGGGDGGLDVAFSATKGSEQKRSYALGVGIGGMGGTGADSGDVSLISVGDVIVNAKTVTNADGTTSLAQADYNTGGGAGISVKAIGGGGGTGGINVTGVAAQAGSPMTIGVGGSGGASGDGGDITVVRGDPDDASVRAGAVITFGDNTNGVYVESTGGGGGQAGINAVLGYATDGVSADKAASESFAASVAIGGNGGSSGDGGDVDVTNRGDISTSGVNSDGLVVLSQGGGGGDANVNIGAGSFSKTTALAVAVGGDPTSGGEAGDINVVQDGTIITTGDKSEAMRVQSIGGGGGDTQISTNFALATSNKLTIAIGREGGVGGAGGDVSIAISGLLDTSGAESDGLYAQSVGGGGGKSSATTIGVQTRTGSDTEKKTYEAGLTIGLQGAQGGDGGDVTVTSDADVVTRGDQSRGLYVQSIGGGGGAGGMALNLMMSTFTGKVVLGGDGGTGGIGGTVSVSQSGGISTAGDRSDGILAQSVGGGGGVGGATVTIVSKVEAAQSDRSAGAMSLALGGTGGQGGEGGAVDVRNDGVIYTTGDYSNGVRAQSVGGGGGIGGATITQTSDTAATNNGKDATASRISALINIGGSGGTGGTGGTVDVVNTGLIWTEGDYASGISANSIGGGGGDAGIMTDSATIASGTRATTRTAMNIGGSGGTGGVGGDVTVTNRPASEDESGLIVTKGAESYGIFAQSIGGGGGNGSSIRSISIAKSGKGSTAASLNIGGAGGDGNVGGQVEVYNDGSIDTSGEGAHGVLAQSIGGGGGNGGMVLSLGLDYSKDTTSTAFSVGGIGGDGGDGGTVLVENTGSIVTRGDNADGIVAQSIGGGGGNAAAAITATKDVKAIALAGLVDAVLGMVGAGSGGHGGEVTVIHSGDITVLGEGSQAIVAQSINGGGGELALDLSRVYGREGMPLAGSNDPAATADPRVAARAGAEGATDMNAGSVHVITTGTIGAGGDNAVGSFNQSIGGGGGILRLNLDLVAAPEADEAVTTIADDEEDDAEVGGAAMATAVDVALGGIDGVRNAGGALDNSQVGGTLTNGDNSPGVLDQSIGGGGGRAVIALDIDEGAAIGPVSVALGGQNGTDESSGAVNRDQQGAIVTTGDQAAGAILQSLGGGGGLADLEVTGAGAATVVPTLTLGSTGGTSLSGAAISASFKGGVTTYGDHSAGLVVQSIGAGGGLVNLSGVSTAQTELGGTTGAQGDGGDITVSQDGMLVTAGAASHGVLLQSIGGGGGAILGDGVTGVTLSGDSIGDGGDIAFTQTGGVLTLGDGAYGVAAQSLGGGGGWVDGVFKGSAGGEGAGGAISLTLNDDVMAIGQDGVAVFAQSRGSTGQGDIAISLNGVTRGGSGAGAGVEIDGGASNTVVNTGQISAISGLAINTGGGDDHVDNAGVVIGDVDLGGGDNGFVNRAGATFMAAHTIDLRDTTAGLASARVAAFAALAASPTATLTNSGDFLMGLSASPVPIDLAKGAVFGNLDGQGDPATNPYYGMRVINTVALDGNFVQTSTGHMAFDVAFGPYASDRVNATGSVTVAGTGAVTLTWLQDAKPITLFSTSNAVDNGLNITDTLAMDYRVLTNASGVQLAFTSHFDQGFLNANGRALGQHMNSAITDGDSAGVGRLMALIGNLQAGDEAAYSRIFRELNPEPYLAPLRSQLYSANTFSGRLFSCANPTGPDGKCAWATIERITSRGDADAETLAVKAEGGRLSGGFERPLAGDWSLAAAVGYERLDRVQVDGMRSLADGQGFNAGLGVKRRTDQGAEMAFALSGGWQWMDTMRAVDIFAPGRGDAKPESGYLRTDARFAYVVENGRLFVRPALNVWATGLHQQKFAESGLEGMGVRGDSHTQFIGTANPEVTLGFKLRDTLRSQAAVSFRVGGLFNTTDRIEMPFRLIGSNPSASAADIGTTLDRSAYTAGIDFHVISDDRVSVRFNYDRQFGDKTTSQSAGLDIRVRF